MDGFSIKSLEWKENPHDQGCWSANGLGSNYLVFFLIKDFALDRNGTEIGTFPTEAEAKAAAQADYDARLRSALLPNPKTEAEAEPTIIRDLQRHVDEIGHTEIGQDISAAIEVIRSIYAHPPKLEMSMDDFKAGMDELATDAIVHGLTKPEATEGGAHEKGAIDALIIGSYVNDAAHNLLVNHTGMEGGCPRVDWYKLRHEIACALETAIYDFRVASAAPTGWRAE